MRFERDAPREPGPLVLGWSDAEAEREERVALIRAAWLDAYCHLFTRDEIEGVFDGRLRQSGSWQSARAAACGTLAARREGRLAGLASLGLLRSGDAELAGLYVLPREQGRGVGRALWGRALEEFRLRGCPRMEVWTLAGGAARGFYEARGCRAFAEGSYTVAGHSEPAVGYELDLLDAASTGSQSIPAR